MKTVLVFGIFDGLHPGHLYFLKEASRRGERLVVVVGRDVIVQELKKKSPREDEIKRIEKISVLPYVHQVFLGDATLGEYTILRTTEPSLICLGYDQHALGEDLGRRMAQGLLPYIPLEVIDGYQPDKFKSSLL